jgi:hypothetical protein
MTFLAALGALFVSFPLLAYRGWVFSVLWGWFVAPYFGLPVLPVTVAMGVTLLVGLITHPLRTEETEEEKKTPIGERLIFGLLLSFFSSSLMLLFGWIITLFP